MLLEDDRHIRQFVASTLDSEGYRVATAGSVREANLELGRNQPDLLVPDLGLLSYVSRIVAVDPARRRIVVERRAEGGVQVLETAMPALITMLEGSNELRFATTPGMFRAVRASVRHWDRAAAGIEDIKQIGLKGSPTIISRVFGPTPRAEKARLVAFDPADPDASAANLKQLLDEMPKVRKELESRRANTR